MQTFLLTLIIILLACTVGCLGYLIYLSHGINHILFNLGYDIFDLARKLRAVPWEKESKKTYQKEVKA